MGTALLLTDQDERILAPGDAGIEQISLQHRIVLGHDRNDHRRVFGVLALVDGRRIGQDQGVELAESVGHGMTVEARGEFAGVRIRNGGCYSRYSNSWTMTDAKSAVSAIRW